MTAFQFVSLGFGGTGGIGGTVASGGIAKSGEAAKSGPIGFAVILVLCVVCYFLFKSMSKHLRKVREDFPTEGAEASAPPSTTSHPDERPATGATASDGPGEVGVEPGERS